MTPILTVAICTHNRPDDLADCLRALYSQDLAGLQIVVVDSASDEDLRQRIAEVIANKANLTLIRLEAPGISAARNTAVATAAAPWLGYLDDDVVPSKDWVEQAKRLIVEAQEICPVIAGRVDPIYQAGGDPKHGSRWGQLLSLVQEEGEGEVLRDAQLICGNAIFRCDALRAIGAFPEQLGRVGDVLLSGEEKLVVERLCEAGWRVLYSDRLCVGHKIPPARLTGQWVARRAYWDGVTDQKIRQLMRRPISILEVVKITAAIPVLAALAPIQSREHEFFIRFWYNVGFIQELLFPVQVRQLNVNSWQLAT